MKRIIKNIDKELLKELFIPWYSIFKFFRGKKIAILGMKGAGKTTLLNKLQGKEELVTTTSLSNYDKFVVKLPNGGKFTVSKGKDIGGSDDYAETYYESMIEESEAIFFLFDVNRFANDVEYGRECNGRLDFMHKKSGKKQIFIIGTHVDESEVSKDEIKNFIHDKLVGKPYNPLLNHLNLINLTSNDDLNSLLNNLKNG